MKLKLVHLRDAVAVTGYGNKDRLNAQHGLLLDADLAKRVIRVQFPGSEPGYVPFENVKWWSPADEPIEPKK